MKPSWTLAALWSWVAPRRRHDRSPGGDVGRVARGPSSHRGVAAGLPRAAARRRARRRCGSSPPTGCRRQTLKFTDLALFGLPAASRSSASSSCRRMSTCCRSSRRTPTRSRGRASASGCAARSAGTSRSRSPAAAGPDGARGHVDARGDDARVEEADPRIPRVRRAGRGRRARAAGAEHARRRSSPSSAVDQRAVRADELGRVGRHPYALPVQHSVAIRRPASRSIRSRASTFTRVRCCRW